MKRKSLLVGVIALALIGGVGGALAARPLATHAASPGQPPAGGGAANKVLPGGTYYTLVFSSQCAAAVRIHVVERGNDGVVIIPPMSTVTINLGPGVRTDHYELFVDNDGIVWDRDVFAWGVTDRGVLSR